MVPASRRGGVPPALRARPREIISGPWAAPAHRLPGRRGPAAAREPWGSPPEPLDIKFGPPAGQGLVRPASFHRGGAPTFSACCEMQEPVGEDPTSGVSSTPLPTLLSAAARGLQRRGDTRRRCRFDGGGGRDYADLRPLRHVAARPTRTAVAIHYFYTCPLPGDKVPPPSRPGGERGKKYFGAQIARLIWGQRMRDAVPCHRTREPRNVGISRGRSQQSRARARGTMSEPQQLLKVVLPHARRG